MNEEIPTCKDCGQPMIEVGGINKPIQIGDYDFDLGNGMKGWRQTGIRDSKLYQCPECKDVKIQ